MSEDGANIRVDNEMMSRVERFYTQSSEKPLLRERLNTILGSQKFASSLDVGAGSGIATEPLAMRSKDLTLIEPAPKYREVLRKKYPTAKIHIGSLDSFPLTKIYDTILFSQTLYFFKEKEWLSVCSRLLGALRPGGSLLVVINSDYGDWWKVVSHFWAESPKNKAFSYMPFTSFVKQCKTIGDVKTHSFHYEHQLESGKDVADLIAHGILAIQDDSRIREMRNQTIKYAENFREVSGGYRLRVKAEIIVVRK